MTVHVTNKTIPGSQGVVLLKPDGTQLTSASSIWSSFDLPQVTLPTTGTYTISVNPSGSNSGSLDLSVTSP